MIPSSHYYYHYSHYYDTESPSWLSSSENKHITQPMLQPDDVDLSFCYVSPVLAMPFIFMLFLCLKRSKKAGSAGVHGDQQTNHAHAQNTALREAIRTFGSSTRSHSTDRSQNNSARRRNEEKSDATSMKGRSRKTQNSENESSKSCLSQHSSSDRQRSAKSRRSTTTSKDTRIQLQPISKGGPFPNRPNANRVNPLDANKNKKRSQDSIKPIPGMYVGSDAAGYATFDHMDSEAVFLKSSRTKSSKSKTGIKSGKSHSISTVSLSEK